MQLRKNVSLSSFSTMALGGQAAYLIEVNDRQEVAEAYSWAANQGLPCLVIGGGSNIVWRDEGFTGLVIVNQIKGYEIYKEDGSNFYITIGAGEDWDSVVSRSVNDNLSGIEALSLIPGSAGATPVQNVGAYGQEISQTLTALEAFDTKTQTFITLSNSDCGFGYRTSRFKTNDKGRYFITSLTLHLMKTTMQPPFYAVLASYLEQHHIKDYSPANIRQAVIAIRSSKLPDPKLVKNVGSFFANPIVSEDKLSELLGEYNVVPHWPVKAGQVKLSAAWLIEQAGFRDFHDDVTGMATWPRQSLVLVNEK